MNILLLGGIAALACLAVLMLFASVFLRRVVPTNEVHIVQTKKHTISYGKGETAGNTYWKWPGFIPVFGMSVSELPVSVFQLKLVDYPAYDTNRVPFTIDVVAFFRIADSNTAAARVANFTELMEQLTAVVQGAARTILASHEINSIMVERSKFGLQFTQEVQEQLKEWGVDPVKNIELMDIRDAKDSAVIHNIMSKQTSAIERDARITVADNKRLGQNAEIEATQQIALRQQEADQLIGQRSAEKDQAVGIADQKAQQNIAEEAKVTKTKEMAVLQVESVRKAEINKDVAVVEAEEHRQVSITATEGDKQKAVLIAEGDLEARRRSAEAVRLEGEARAAAESLLQKAGIVGQIDLAKEIGSNVGYQHYLLGVRNIEANQSVGVAQAEALKQAGIKIIATTGSNVGDGIKSISDLFSPQGGLQLGGMLDGLANTAAGKAAVEAATGNRVVVD